MSRAGAHLRRKAPRKTRGFAWARIPNDDRGFVTWRLTRRDVEGKLYCVDAVHSKGTPRGKIARDLWRQRQVFRDTVDDVSLRQLGVLA